MPTDYLHRNFVQLAVLPRVRRTLHRLSPRERQALTCYIRDSEPVNKLLRGQDMTRPRMHWDTFESGDQIQLLKSGLEKLRPYRGTSFRGMFLTVAEVEALTTARVWSDPGFLSTATEYRVALGYADLARTIRHEADQREGRPSTPGYLVLMQIDGVRGREISAYHPSAVGREILFPPDLIFARRGSVFENGVLKVHLTEQ